jgi:hypothetical protein
VDTVGPADEEAVAEDPFEGLDSLAEAGLGVAELWGGGGDAAGVGGVDEGADQGDVEGLGSVRHAGFLPSVGGVVVFRALIPSAGLGVVLVVGAYGGPECREPIHWSGAAGRSRHGPGSVGQADLGIGDPGESVHQVNGALR